jgi:hypothetical protein
MGFCIITAIFVFINPDELYWIATINKYFNISCMTFQSACSSDFLQWLWVAIMEGNEWKIKITGLRVKSQPGLLEELCAL